MLTLLYSTMFLLSFLPLDLPFNTTGLNIFISFILLAYVFTSIQSVLYSFVMEFYVNNKIKNNVIAIGVSTLLGALFGLLVQLMTVGTLTGLIMGIVLRSLYLKKPWLKHLMWILPVMFLLVVIAFNIKYKPSVNSARK